MANTEPHGWLATDDLSDAAPNMAKAVTKAGVPIVRKFPFAYNAPNLVNGTPIYTPTVGEVLYDAWIEVTTAWNGTTPHGQIGMCPQVPNLVVNPSTTSAPPLLLNTSTDMTALTTDRGNGQGLGLLSILRTNLMSGGSSGFVSRFTSTSPLRVVVNRAGSYRGLNAAAGGDVAATVPLTVVSGTNNQFVYTGGGGAGAPETFTVAAGTYNTFAAVLAAMAAATGSVSGERFDTLVTLADEGGGVIGLTMIQPGGAQNNNTITPGTHDVSAALGFNSPPDTFYGAPVDSGSTQGSAILYLVTATPV